MSSELLVTLRTAMAKETCLGVRARPFLQQNIMSWQMDKTFACFESPSLISSSVKFSSPVTIQDTRLKSIVGIIDASYSFEQSSGSGGCLPTKYALCIGLLVGSLVEISVNSFQRPHRQKPVPCLYSFVQLFLLSYHVSRSDLVDFS